MSKKNRFSAEEKIKYIHEYIDGNNSIRVSVKVLAPFIILIIVLKYPSKAFKIALLGLNYFLSLIFIFSGILLDQGIRFSRASLSDISIFDRLSNK